MKLTHISFRMAKWRLGKGSVLVFVVFLMEKGNKKIIKKVLNLWFQWLKYNLLQDVESVLNHLKHPTEF